MATNEEIVRKAYSTAESKDVVAFAALFADDGIVRDMSTTGEYSGPDVRQIVDIYARAFPNMRRELYHFYNGEGVVVVQLSLNGAHEVLLSFPSGPFRRLARRCTPPAATYGAL